MGTSSRQRRTRGAMALRYAGPSAPRRAHVSSSGWASMAADPSSRGCASGSGGWIHSRPCSASGKAAKAGELTASGCTAEQTSCTNPGRVSSAERAPPPMVGCASNTVVRNPAFARTMAAVRPLGPEPITHALLLSCLTIHQFLLAKWGRLSACGGLSGRPAPFHPFLPRSPRSAAG